MSTVLITGASGGIGYELAKLFARDRHNLILVARSGDKLAQVANELRAVGVSVTTFALDLGTPTAPKFLFDQIQSAGLTVDILINNAGFGAFGEFAQMSNEEISGQIQLNIIAPDRTHSFLSAAMLPPTQRSHHECCVHCRISTRPTDGCLLRHQGLRDFLLRSDCQ